MALYSNISVDLIEKEIVTVEFNTVARTTQDYITAHKIKLYEQATEPTLTADDYVAIWKDTNDSNRIYLIFRRGSGDQVRVELS